MLVHLTERPVPICNYNTVNVRMALGIESEPVVHPIALDSRGVGDVEVQPPLSSSSLERRVNELHLGSS